MRDTYSEAQLARAVATGSGAQFGTVPRLMGGRGQLSPAQIVACDTYAEIVEAAQRCMGPKQMRAGSLEQGIGATPPDPDSPHGQRQAIREAIAMGKYHGVLRAIEMFPTEQVATFTRHVMDPPDPRTVLVPLPLEDRTIIGRISLVLAAYFAREIRRRKRR